MANILCSSDVHSHADMPLHASDMYTCTSYDPIGI